MDQHTENHSVLNTILLLFTGLFTMLERASAEEIYTWTFRFLSLISLILIIIINWKKAMQILFKK